MWLVRQVDGGPLQSWEVNAICVQWPENTRSEPKFNRHKPKRWTFGEPVKRASDQLACLDHYPMLVRPGSAALGNTMVEALDLLAGE